MNELIWAIWLFLPAGIANAAPVFASRLPLLKHWKAPLDAGKSYRGIRMLGNNKTWRGLIFGVIVAGLVALLQSAAYEASYPSPIFIFGILLGFGALAGDAVESFFKRQKGVLAGESWFPFDQTDYIIGGLLLSWPLADYSISQAVTIFIVYFGLHLIVSYLGYLTGLKNKPI